MLQGIFDKPNIAGFVQVSHYLLMICDAERFRKLIEWPVLCKKTEAKYRNDVKDYLNIIAVENPDMGFPHILATYLHHASGTKFMLIMWKLSQLALKRYLMRNGKYFCIIRKIYYFCYILLYTYTYIYVCMYILYIYVYILLINLNVFNYYLLFF